MFRPGDVLCSTFRSLLSGQISRSGSGMRLEGFLMGKRGHTPTLPLQPGCRSGVNFSTSRRSIDGWKVE